EPVGADLDATSGRGDHGAFLQQRFAPERIGSAGCCQCRSLHRIGARFWQRKKGARLSGRHAGIGGDLQISCRRECAFRTALYKQIEKTNLAALDLADLETLSATY